MGFIERARDDRLIRSQREDLAKTSQASARSLQGRGAWVRLRVREVARDCGCDGLGRDMAATVEAVRAAVIARADRDRDAPSVRYGSRSARRRTGDVPVGGREPRGYKDDDDFPITSRRPSAWSTSSCTAGRTNRRWPSRCQARRAEDIWLTWERLLTRMSRRSRRSARDAGESFVTLSSLAAARVVAGYGGGIAAAMAALESDVRMLAFEAGRKWGPWVNAVSAGPWKSRAAEAIGPIDRNDRFHGTTLTIARAGRRPRSRGDSRVVGESSGHGNHGKRDLRGQGVCRDGTCLGLTR